MWRTRSCIFVNFFCTVLRFGHKRSPPAHGGYVKIQPGSSSPLLFRPPAGLGTGSQRLQVVFDHPDPEPIVGSIIMPFASGRNPHTDAVASANADWIVELGLLERDTPAFLKFGAAGFEELAGLVHRDDDYDTLLLAANFITALFFLDDMVDAAGSRVGSEAELVRRMAALMNECVRSGLAPAQLSAAEWQLPSGHREKLVAIGQALADVTRRLRALPHGLDIEHYVREMDEYLQGVVSEADHRRHEHAPHHAFESVADYEAVRTKFSAMYACVEFGGLLRGLSPSPLARGSRPYRRMARNTNLCVSYVNDLFSYKKEFLLGESSNLVMVLEHTDGLARAAAFRRACKISDLVVLQYLDDKELCSNLDVDAIAGMELMESWMRGNYDWYVGRTFRYVDALSTHESSSSHPIVRG